MKSNIQKLGLENNIIKSNIQKLELENDKMKSNITELKNKVCELKFIINSKNIKYDYDEMKNSKKKLHNEYNRIYKLIKNTKI